MAGPRGRARTQDQLFDWPVRPATTMTNDLSCVLGCCSGRSDF